MIDITGAIDIHVHSSPELFPRIGDAVDIAERARDLGIAGLVFKCHHEPTMTRAALAERMVEGVQCWGGIVLNQFVGGINPVAVSAALDQGAKIVWLPTMHAANHMDEVGRETYGIASMTLPPSSVPSEGIRVTDPDGALTEPAKDVIKLVAAHGATIATGHVGPEEILAVARGAKDAGARCLVTHAFFPHHSLELLVEAVSLGAWIELAAIVAQPMARHFKGGMTLGQAKELIESVSADRVVISTDAGQIHNPWPADILRAFAQQMVAVGVEADDVGQMIRENPRKLLGIPTD